MSTFTASGSKALFILGDLNADYYAFKQLVEDAEESREPEIHELHLVLTGNSGIIFPQQLEKISALLPSSIFLHYAGGSTAYDNWDDMTVPAGEYREIARRIFRHGSGSLLSIGGSSLMLIGRCESLKGERTQRYNAENEKFSAEEKIVIQKNLRSIPHILVSPLPPLAVLQACTRNLFETDSRRQYLKSQNAAFLDELIFKKNPMLWIHSCPHCLPACFDTKGIQHIFLNGISYSSNSIAYLYDGDIFFNN